MLYVCKVFLGHEKKNICSHLSLNTNTPIETQNHFVGQWWPKRFQIELGKQKHLDFSIFNIPQLFVDSAYILESWIFSMPTEMHIHPCTVNIAKLFVEFGTDSGIWFLIWRFLSSVSPSYSRIVHTFWDRFFNLDFSIFSIPQLFVDSAYLLASWMFDTQTEIPHPCRRPVITKTFPK